MEARMEAGNNMKVRFGLEMSQQTEALLNRLAAEDGSTPSQVMSKALALFDVTARVAAAGQRVIVTDGAGAPIREIVGLLNSPQVADQKTNSLV
jgi:hypothetical protein